MTQVTVTSTFVLLSYLLFAVLWFTISGENKDDAILLPLQGQNLSDSLASYHLIILCNWG